MRRTWFQFIAMLFLSLLLSNQIEAQSWNFIKEKNGISLYTCKEAGKSLKSYKAVADIHAPSEKVFALIEDIYHTDWWDKNLTLIKVLFYEKYKRAQYYCIYNLPWPVTDRDLCVNITATFNPVTGNGIITAIPLEGAVPERLNILRIKAYRQIWTVVSNGKNLTHIILEGYVDPAGSIPDWISNMLIIDSPYNAISNIRQRLENK